MKKSEAILKEMFHPYRDKRSEVYKSGALAALKFKLKEIPTIDIPHKAGTVEFDAFYAGMDEGKDYFIDKNVKI